MEAGLHELPLVFFTVFGQSVVGAFISIALTLWTVDGRQYRANLYKSVFFLLVLLGVGVVLSFFHLGSPLRAINALNQTGSSMLSNEIASSMLFSGLLGLGWLLYVSGKLSPAAEKSWLLASALAGLLFMYFMNRVYHISTVPTWNNLSTTLSFYLTAVVAGGVLGYTLLAISMKNTLRLSWLLGLIAMAMVLTVVVMFYQYTVLNDVHNTVKSMGDTLNAYPKISALSLIGLAAAMGLLFAANEALLPLRGYCVIATVLVLASEILLRILFYAMHTTVGMA